MKYILIFFMIVSNYSNASTFIGDSIAHGFMIANNASGTTKVGANPKLVNNFILNTSTDDNVVLSTGASNNCSDIKTIKNNINLSLKKFKHVTLLSAPYCGNYVNYIMKSQCINNCKFVVIEPSIDGIHPKKYNTKL